MQYTYEFEVVQDDGWYVVMPFDMEGATHGKTIEDAALMAADWLRTDIEHRLIHDIDLPKPTFGNKPTAGGTCMVVSVEASLGRIERMSASEAARKLGVSPGRVSHMIRDGLLEAFRDGHKTYVTAASVEMRLHNARKAGRPRKAAAA